MRRPLPCGTLYTKLLLLIAGAPQKELARQVRRAISLAEVRCEQRLGGLLKHYYRKAA